MAKKLIPPNTSSSAAFALIEVLIATLIFAVFVAVFVNSQGSNVSLSLRLGEEIRLRNLAEMKINEIILAPPNLTASLTTVPETKTVEDNKDYEYIIEWKRFEVPDLNKIQGQEEDSTAEDSSPYKKILYDQIKNNLKELIWQVKVTVKNKKTGYPYSISTWIINNDADVKIGQL